MEFFFIVLLVFSNLIESDAFNRMTSFPRKPCMQSSSTNNENNQLGGDLATKGLFGLTELFGKISNPFMSSSTTISSAVEGVEATTKPSTTTPPKDLLSVANSIKKEYEKIFWATGNMNTKVHLPILIYSYPPIITSFFGTMLNPMKLSYLLHLLTLPPNSINLDDSCGRTIVCFQIHFPLLEGILVALIDSKLMRTTWENLWSILI